MISSLDMRSGESCTSHSEGVATRNLELHAFLTQIRRRNMCNARVNTRTKTLSVGGFVFFHFVGRFGHFRSRELKDVTAGDKDGESLF